MPRLVSWSDLQYYSIQHDAEVCKISAFDERHMEYWVIIEAGRGMRDRRNAALELIMDWIEAGKPIGEVK